MYIKMLIGFDGTLLDSETGIGYYSYNLLQSISDFSVARWFKVFVSPKVSKKIDFLKKFSILPTYSKIRLYHSNWHVLKTILKEKLTLYHSVDNITLPLIKLCKYVITVHDLVPILYPNTVSKLHTLSYYLCFRRITEIADIIITVSENTKRDLIRLFKVPEEKIRVIYNGYDKKTFRIVDESEAIARIKLKYKIDTPSYLLYVGALEPKKNLGRLIDAYYELIKTNRDLRNNYKLVIVGKKAWMYKDIFKEVKRLGIESYIIFTGFVPQEDLVYLYNGAKLFLFPSIYEGFGLPVLEAMACGVPVVTSNISSLPEITGDAALLVNPLDPKEITKAILRLLYDEQLYLRLKQNGLKQAQKFSWERCAYETLEAYLEVLM